MLQTPALSDSLAGRMETVRLHPLAQCELQDGLDSSRSVDWSPGFLDVLFGRGFESRRTERLGKELIERIVSGGYPAALARPAGRRRANWYRNYLDAQMQRDVPEIARIRSLDVLPRLLTHAAVQTASLFNLSELAAPFQVSRPTIRDYVTLLERVFLLEQLPPWHSNRLKRLVKHPSSIWATLAWPVLCSALTQPVSPPTGPCWGSCWKPLSTRSCAVKLAGTPTPSPSSTSATGTASKWTSSSSGGHRRWRA